MKLSLATNIAALAFLTPHAFAGVLPDCVNGLLKSNKVCDQKASPRDRAAALIEILKPSEKLLNIVRYVLT
jgi:beta-D-xylosidase 4